RGKEAGRCFRRNVQEHAGLLYQALAGGDVLDDVRLTTVGELAAAGKGVAPAGPDDLRAWADLPRELAVAEGLPAGSPLLNSGDLVGDIQLRFDRLLPVYACAVEDDPVPILAGRAGGDSQEGSYTEGDFRRATYLDDDWVKRARALLGLKRQLILQGVP